MSNIDFVIPWVDGSDKEWLEKKNKYLPEDKRIDIDATDARYRDWDNLKFWFRAVEKNAPWVNKIYFVTDNQRPEWLNIEHEKLVMVDHRDYIPEKYLPVFSANPIELNFHRIKGLSEQFVYFNDDMFLLDSVSEEDFFVNGLPCDLAVESPITPDSEDIFNHILLNDIALLNRHFNRNAVLKEQKKKMRYMGDKKGLVMNMVLSTLKRDAFFGFEYSHLTSSFLKSTYEKVWEEDGDWLDKTSATRFRSAADVNQYIFSQRQYVTGKFVPRSWRKLGKAIHIDDSNEDNIREVVDVIKNRKYKMVCVNESHVEHFEETKTKVNSALEMIYPDKSSFEK